MNLKELKELIEVVNRSAITQFEMEQDGLKLSLRKDTALPTEGARDSASVIASAATTPLALSAVPGMPAVQGVPIVPAVPGLPGVPDVPGAVGAASANLSAASAAPFSAVPVTASTSTSALPPAQAEAIEEEGICLVKSPMVGVFYEAPQPGAPPFVKVGDRISIGQVLCIIEAMKLMNEVQAEVEGTIVEVLIKNEEMAEYGQPLFKVKCK
ncbi:MAG: acetyl-CoA carboxylase biotin carboxyl carrier protein [Bacillota bacterium]